MRAALHLTLLAALVPLITPAPLQAQAASPEAAAPKPAQPSSAPPPPKPAQPEPVQSQPAEPEAGAPAAGEAPPQDAAKPEPTAGSGTDQATADPQAETRTDTRSQADAPPLPETLRGSDLGHSACLLTLYLMGTRYSEKPAISDENRDCGILRPIAVSQILPGVTLAGEPVMRCETARQLAFWLHGAVLPAARFLPEPSRLSGVTPGSTYQCRAVIGTQSSAKVSEHALGNAFDIAGFTFENGATYTVAPRQDDGDMAEAFLAAIRGSACLYFTTVLGPGSNDAHDDHLHLDIKARKGGFRICQ